MLLVFSVGGVFRSWRVAGECMPDGAVVEAIVREQGVDIVRGPGFDPATYEPMYGDCGTLLRLDGYIGCNTTLVSYCDLLRTYLLRGNKGWRLDSYSRVDVHALAITISIDGFLADLRRLGPGGKWTAHVYLKPESLPRTTPARALARARAEAIGRGEW